MSRYLSGDKLHSRCCAEIITFHDLAVCSLSASEGRGVERREGGEGCEGGIDLCRYEVKLAPLQETWKTGRRVSDRRCRSRDEMRTDLIDSTPLPLPHPHPLSRLSSSELGRGMGRHL